MKKSSIRYASILLAFLYSAGLVHAQEHDGSRPQPAITPAAVDAGPQVNNDILAAALKPFHKLINAGEIGVSFIEYKRLLLDAKTDFDVAIVEVPKGAQRDELVEAMRDYILASDVWSVSIDNAVWCSTRNQPAGVPMKTDLYRSLRARVGEDILPSPKLNACARQEVLVKVMWLSAARRIQHVMKLQEQN